MYENITKTEIRAYKLINYAFRCPMIPLKMPFSELENEAHDATLRHVFSAS